MKGGTLLLIGSAVVIGFFYRDFTGKSLTESIFPRTENSSINAALVKAARKQNSRLPMVYANGQEWLSISAGDMRMTNYYRLGSTYPEKNSLYASTKNAVCTDPYTRQMIDKGVTFEYVYMGGANNHLFQYSINLEKCNRRQVHPVTPKRSEHSADLIDSPTEYGIQYKDGRKAVIEGNIDALRQDMKSGLGRERLGY